MSLLVSVLFTNGSQAPFLWRQELSLLSAPKQPPEVIFLLKSDLDCSFSRRQALVQQGKAAGQAHWGMWRLWYSSTPVVSGAKGAHQIRLQVLPAII